MSITNELLDELRDVQLIDNSVEDAKRAWGQIEEIAARFSAELEAAARMAAALQAYYEDAGIEVCITCRHEKYYPDSSGVSFSGGWQCEPDWWVRECRHPDPAARAQIDEIYDALFPDGDTKYGVHIPPVTGCQWWEARDSEEAIDGQNYRRQADEQRQHAQERTGQFLPERPHARGDGTG